MDIDDRHVIPVVAAGLAEDLGRAGDLTSEACIPAGTRIKARYSCRKEGRLAGLSCGRLAIAALDPTLTFTALAQDGDDIAAGQILAEVEADGRALLAAERAGLNLLGHLSGVATLTRAYVRAVAGTRAKIADTRKTTPGLRALEKYAVRCGGGVNHRFGLDDAILIKDNHVAACGSVGEAVRRARAHAGHLVKIEVEVDRMDQIEAALAEKPDVVLIDNFSLADLATAVKAVNRRAVIEASGGVNLDNVGAIAATGVDIISVGALTHSASVLDIGLDV